MKTARTHSTRGLAIALAVAFGALWVGPAQVTSAPPPPPSLAVLPITVTSLDPTPPESDDLRSELADSEKATAFLRSQLARHAGYALVDAGAIARAVAAFRGHEDRCRSPRCVVEIGKATGADLVLVTGVSNPGSISVLVNGVLVDVRHARVVHQERLELRGKPDEMIRAGLASLARRMDGVAAAARVAARP